jgi:hypothetical protein
MNKLFNWSCTGQRQKQTKRKNDKMKKQQADQ